MASTMTIDQIPAEVIERVIALAAEGKSHKQLASALGFSYQTYWELRKRDAAFASLLNQARELGGEVLLESLLTVVEDNPDLDPNLVRVKADCLKFYVVKAFPSKYGDRLEVKHSQVDIGTAITDARQRAAIDITPQPAQLIEPTTDQLDPFA